MQGIYKITNKINNKCYIGQSINIDRRWKQEKNKAFNGSDPSYNTALSVAFRKYGVESFTFEVIEELPEEQLNEREIYWIKYYNSLVPNGYNLQAGGVYSYHPDPLSSSILTYEEVEEIRSLLKQGHRVTHIAADFGMSISAIQAINIGRSWRSPNIVYPIAPRTNQGKSVGQYLKDGTLVNIYASAREAEQITGINASSISSIAKNEGQNSRKTAGGYMWRIVDDPDNATNIEPIKYICDNQHPYQPKVNKTARGKTIGQYTAAGELIATYDCMKTAAAQTGISNKQISAVIRGTHKTAGGFVWKVME